MPPLFSVIETSELTGTPTRWPGPRLASDEAGESARTASTTPLRWYGRDNLMPRSGGISLRTMASSTRSQSARRYWIALVTHSRVNLTPSCCAIFSPSSV